MSATVAPGGPAPRSGGLFGRMARCLSVSVLTTLLSLVTLALLVGWWGTIPWVANVIATAVGTVPSYVLNRRWVWGRDGSSDVWREVVPFWILSFSGLVLSTAAVATQWPCRRSSRMPARFGTPQPRMPRTRTRCPRSPRTRTWTR